MGFGEGREKKKCGRRKGKEALRSRGKEETVNCVGGGGGRGRGGWFWVFGKKATLKWGGGVSQGDKKVGDVMDGELWAAMRLSNSKRHHNLQSSYSVHLGWISFLLLFFSLI